MRLINRLLAALLALAVVVGGALVVIEVVRRWFSADPAIVHWRRIYGWAKRTPWDQGSVRVTCIVMVVLGLLLLIAELRRAPVTRLAADPDQSDAAGIDTAYTRRGTAAAVRKAVADVDGVRSVTVGIGRRKVTVNAVTGARDKTTAQTFREPITVAAQQRLDSLKLKSTPSVSVTVTPRST